MSKRFLSFIFSEVIYMKKISSAIFALLLAVCAALSGCGGGAEDGVVASETAVVYGGVLNLSVGMVDTLNPLLARDETLRDGLFAVYEPLIAVTSDQELKGVLAESWSFNEGCTVLTVKLKKGVLWHDGSQLLARDVVYSVNTIKSDPDGPYAQLLRWVSAATEADAYTVNFVLTRSYSQLPWSLYFPIISLNAGDLTSVAIGTGPFMFESYSPGRELTLTRFEGYRDGNAGFDKVALNVVRESITAASAFSTGGTNAVQGRIFDMNEFAVRDKYEVRRACGDRFEYIGLNHRRPIFASATVRAALSGAIDRQELIKSSYGEMASPANLPFHPMSLSFTPSKGMTDFDIAAASESLFYDGWTDSSGDGILSKDVMELERTDEDGESYTDRVENVRLEFTLLVNRENSRRVVAANAAAGQLREAGFDVTVEELDFDAYLERIRSGDFDAYLGGTRLGNLYDVEFLLGSDGEQNNFGYSSSYMDEALARLSASDGEAFANACSLVQDVFTRDQPFVGLAFLDESLVLDRAIAGGTNPLFHSPFGNVGKWFYVN